MANPSRVFLSSILMLCIKRKRSSKLKWKREIPKSEFNEDDQLTQNSN